MAGLKRGLQARAMIAWLMHTITAGKKNMDLDPPLRATAPENASTNNLRKPPPIKSPVYVSFKKRLRDLHAYLSYDSLQRRIKDLRAGKIIPSNKTWLAVRVLLRHGKIREGV